MGPEFLGVLLQLERHVADADLAHGEVGPVHLPLLAELRQELDGLHGVAPLIVAAPENWHSSRAVCVHFYCTQEACENQGSHLRIVSGRDAAGGPVPAEEPVLEIDLGLADEVVRTEQVPVKHRDREDGVLREGGFELEELSKDLAILMDN